MNKSIILSAMLALSMPALAADVLYVNGDDTQTINGQTPSWSVVTPIEVQPTNGKFIVEVKSFSDISISTVKAATEDWTIWENGQYCISKWVKDVLVDADPWQSGTNFPGQFVGCTTALEQKAQSMGAANAGMNGDYTFVFDQALTQCQILPHALYLTGDETAKINNVAANYDIANSVKVSKADGVFTFNVTIPGGAKTRINVSTTTPLSGNRAWEFYNAGQFSATINSATLGTAVDLAHASTGLIFAEDVPAGDYTVTISEDLSTITVGTNPANIFIAGGTEVTVDDVTSTGWDPSVTNPFKIQFNDEMGVFAFKLGTAVNDTYVDISTLWANDGTANYSYWNKGKFSTADGNYTAENVNTRQSLSNRASSIKVAKAGTYNVAVARDMSYVILCENTEGTIDTGTENYYATFSNPYSDIELGGNGIEVYNVTVSSDQLVLTKRSDNKVAKGEGVLVKVSSDATITVKPIDAGLTAASEAENYLVPTPVTAGTVSESGFKLYRLAYDNFTNKTGLGFYLDNNDGSITYTTAKPYKAYLKVPTAQAAQIKKFLLNPQPTHVDGINVNEQETDKAIYDISGRRVENPTPGFYIQGNKKIVIR